jgi:hypothetical protein
VVESAYESADEVPEDVADAVLVETPVLPDLVVLEVLVVDGDEVDGAEVVVAAGADVVVVLAVDGVAVETTDDTESVVTPCL